MWNGSNLRCIDRTSEIGLLRGMCTSLVFVIAVTYLGIQGLFTIAGHVKNLPGLSDETGHVCYWYVNEYFFFMGPGIYNLYFLSFRLLSAAEFFNNLCAGYIVRLGCISLLYTIQNNQDKYNCFFYQFAVEHKFG